MKIAIVPDNHLNLYRYKGVYDKQYPKVLFRSADFMRSFEWIVDKCINDLHPDLFVIPGDVYDSFDPSNEIRGFFSIQLEKLTSAKIPVIILVGNHEICQKHHALKDLQELHLKSIKIYDQPTTLTLSKSNIKLLLFPYSLDIEQKKITLKEAFNQFVDKIQEEKDDTPSIFFGHFGVRGGKLNQYEVEKANAILGDILEEDEESVTTETRAFINTNPNDVSVDDLDRIGAEYVFLGDYHEHQVLGTSKCVAIYPGSIEKTDFSEVDQKKGFDLYDSEAQPNGELGKCQFVEYPNCRPMKELKGNFAQIKKQFAELDPSEHQEAVVKIHFEGTSEELLDFSIGLEPFKKEIRTALNPIHICHVQKVRDKAQEEIVSKLEQEILDKGHIETDDIIAIVKEVVREQVDDKKEQEATIALAIEIANEIAEGVK